MIRSVKQRGDYVIRIAKSTDVPHLTKIVKQTIKVMADEKNDQWDQTYPLPEHFHNDIKNETLYVKESNGEIAGSITIDRHFSDAYQTFSWHQSLSDSVTFHRLVVNPTIRKQGVAGELIDYAETWAKNNGFTSMKVDTYSLNQKAQSLFLRQHYQPVGELTLPERAHAFLFYEKDLTKKAELNTSK
ncbi:GNAT family N-acetyltransferase [Alkalicoccobacillus murimartini]|uniref:GNAT superfamily N-acetyltransferase n=1 Tax=Alkalicoccobacillus murimartini TaxID=171685 RepID=A0ABT9YJ22_9BACI|nr:GNAT family N-acetyltransferase [Alkalicoccobacillus murimartini]MDQ0207716.1 GNAT superfamily N-acetyltransferase [Alkalicoccobacillus murimartini]